MMRASHFRLFGIAVFASALAACGGGGSTGATSGSNLGGTGGTGGTGTGTSNNVAPLAVDFGPQALLNSGFADEDVAFTSITLCVPGSTTQCQTIDHVEVDTGSEGLRIPSSVLALSLPQQTSGGNTVAECTQFADLTFAWGPVASADIQIAGEVAKNVPIQIMQQSTPPVPSACSSGQTGGQLFDVPSLGANAILGLGLFRQDCGGGCTFPPGTSSNPGFYYACPSSGCTPIAETLTTQVQNPVWMFPTDNNGVLLQLPAVADAGQTRADGSLIFGIGTQSNNGLGSAGVIQVDPGTGNFAAQFMNTTFNDWNGAGSGHGSSFIDSGSNGFFFLDSATLNNQFAINIPDCPQSGPNALVGFYCPGTTQQISVGILSEGSNSIPVGAPRNVTFNVANASVLFQNNFAAFNDVGGENPDSFDFGLPFFFGRTVYTAIEGQPTPGGTGPYVAF